MVTTTHNPSNAWNSYALEGLLLFLNISGASDDAPIITLRRILSLLLSQKTERCASCALSRSRPKPDAKCLRPELFLDSFRLVSSGRTARRSSRLSTLIPTTCPRALSSRSTVKHSIRTRCICVRSPATRANRGRSSIEQKKKKGARLTTTSSAPGCPTSGWASATRLKSSSSTYPKAKNYDIPEDQPQHSADRHGH